MIKTLIVENNPQAAEDISALLKKNFPEIDILEICDSAPRAIQSINNNQPELIFLDVQLEPFTGFDVLEATRNHKYEVIFTTAYDQYAIKAIRFCALDYLEKPFGINELTVAVNRYKSLVATGTKNGIDALLNNEKHREQSKMHMVGIPFTGGIEFIPVSEIIMCKGDSNYTDIYLTAKRKIKASKTLREYEELLKNHFFDRIHDSYLINLYHIKKYSRGGEGGVVELTDRLQADVSRRRKEAFLKRLKGFGII